MRNDRLYQLKDLLLSRPGIGMQDLIHELEVTKATVKRDIEALRDRFDTPIVYDRFHGGYFIHTVQEDTSRRAVKRSELPGLWFSSDEAFALLAAQQLLASIEPGILGSKLKPLTDKLNRLLESNGHSIDTVNSRVKVTQAGKRRMVIESFQTVARATLERKRLLLTHFNRQDGKSQQREVSPQRLVHYRDNWYLDAWCHTRDALRCFSVDAMSQCAMLDTPAKDLKPDDLDTTLGSSYGIFGGDPIAWATLKFTPERSRWVSREIWHSQQKSHTEADGCFVLQVPYSDHRELLGDILKFGADVEVVAPKELKTRVQRVLLQAVGRYV